MDRPVIDRHLHGWFTAYRFTLTAGQSLHSPARPRPGLPQVIVSMLLDGSVASIVDRDTGQDFPHPAWVDGNNGSASAWVDSAVGNYVLTAGDDGLQFLCICRKCDTPWQLDFHDHGGDLTLPAGWVAVAARGVTSCGDESHAALWAFGPYGDDRAIVATDDIVLIGPPAA